MYVETASDEPAFVTVVVGMIGRHRPAFVPVTGEPPAATEPEVFAHYDLGVATGTAGERRLARR